jgi:hypothetical protein
MQQLTVEVTERQLERLMHTYLFPAAFADVKVRWTGGKDVQALTPSMPSGPVGAKAFGYSVLAGNNSESESV